MPCPVCPLCRKRWFAITTSRGQLDDQIKRILQMTGEETSRAQDAIDRFLAGYESLEAAVIRRGEPTQAELKGQSASQVRVFEDHIPASDVPQYIPGYLLPFFANMLNPPAAGSSVGEP